MAVNMLMLNFDRLYIRWKIKNSEERCVGVCLNFATMANSLYGAIK